MVCSSVARVGRGVRRAMGAGCAPAEDIDALRDRIDMRLLACHAALPPLLLNGLHAPVERVDLRPALLEVVAAAAAAPWPGERHGKSVTPKLVLPEGSLLACVSVSDELMQGLTLCTP
eukprot:scaffold82078_cov66-Phaeocystis_antarctica.AAC.5